MNQRLLGWVFIVVWMVMLLVLSLVFFLVVFHTGIAHGQEAPRRPSGRLIPNTPTPTGTATPPVTPTATPTPDPCAECLDPDDYWCLMYPEACAQCWRDCGRPLGTPTATPRPTRTPTRTPTPTPVGYTPPCEWVQTPWGGSHCDVTAVCGLTLVPMHIGEPKDVFVKLVTDKTTNPVERAIPPTGGSMTIDWTGELRFAEWWVRGTDDPAPTFPLKACYCDEKRSKIVFCMSGRFDHEQ